ncbi:hypothetical protein J1N35_009033 [Gossypium stocksii]|uniref:RNase H type-1 domain-containing protein n=1 Tax=Gossypium stocksii TaxID=47602 RepID=A0A9D3WBC8_9ROSI|nr:hypothetical protein J1N35_009033 [Gossypium stocksii]
MENEEKLEEHWLKLNCDRAFDIKIGKAGLGVLVRDSIGLVDSTSLSTVSDSPKMTEALTLKLDVEFAKKRNFEKIIMETNSQIVHNELVKKKGKHRWKLRPIIIMLDRLIK